MKLNEYHLRWFSGVDWSWVESNLLATNEETAREWADKQCKPEYREKRESDSLKIELIQENIQIPYELDPK